MKDACVSLYLLLPILGVARWQGGKGSQWKRDGGMQIAKQKTRERKKHICHDMEGKEETERSKGPKIRERETRLQFTTLFMVKPSEAKPLDVGDVSFGVESAKFPVVSLFSYGRLPVMDLRESFLLLLLALFAVHFCSLVNANLVFPVERKFKGPVRDLSAIKTHDALRRGRFLSVVDVPLGGNGRANSNGLYYTKIQLGSPPQDYYVQVDTGSDILWVNCVGCTTCPRKSGLGSCYGRMVHVCFSLGIRMDLNLYDPNESHTSQVIPCDHEFCTSTYDGPISGCTKEMSCPYSITYGDGSTTTGSYVKDYLTFDKVIGNLQTGPENSTAIFGCGAKQSGTLSSTNDESLDGIIGFGQANSSVLSQLAAAGKVQRVFSHCLDSISGGGIFSIGEVVEPKFQTTPLLPRMAHYNVVLKDMEVGGEALQLPMDIFDSTNGRGTIIDSGTTLAYLPASIYDQVLEKVLAQQSDMKLYLVEDQFTCFHYAEKNVDDGFPVVKFTFDEGLTLTAYPRDYLFLFKVDMWCVGWQKSVAQTRDGKDLILLGGSSSIKVKDEKTGAVYTVGAHDLSSAPTEFFGGILGFFLFIVAMLIT
ncbi:Aspartic proteinase-like protein 2, partial [Mucuna pruriens]